MNTYTSTSFVTNDDLAQDSSSSQDCSAALELLLRASLPASLPWLGFLSREVKKSRIAHDHRHRSRHVVLCPFQGILKSIVVKPEMTYVVLLLGLQDVLFCIDRSCW